MQVGHHSEVTDKIEDDENFLSRDLANYRVFDSDYRVAASTERIEISARQTENGTC